MSDKEAAKADGEVSLLELQEKIAFLERIRDTKSRRERQSISMQKISCLRQPISPWKGKYVKPKSILKR